MNLEFKHLLPADFSPQSRVWIYQCSRLFSMSEALQVESALNDFCDSWHSHGSRVKGFGTLLFGQFLIIMADDSVSVSGCSTDSSVKLVKDLSQQFNVDFFNRTMLAFYIKDKIQLLPLGQVQYAADNGFLDKDTLYFNNLVSTKAELENKWIIPVKDSWLREKLKLSTAS
ncbi:MAG TPA: hypothetical protein VGB56_09845 [Flavisolibacter sp.]